MGLGLAMLATAVVAAHTVQIEHRGARIDAAYHARTEIQTRTIGAYAPNRMDGQRCMWSATVHVERRLADSAALTRAVSNDLRFTGSLAGACPGKTDLIARQVARRSDKVQAHVVAVAARDHAQLVAELDGVRNLASD